MSETEQPFKEAWRLLDSGRAARGFKLLLAAARRGDLSSQLDVGYLYDVGRGVRRSEKDAFLWYRKAARRGDSGAANNIGILYKEKGSLRRAGWWFEKAYALGDGDVLLEMAKLELLSPGGEKAAIRHLRKLRRRRDTTEATQEEARALLERLALGQK